MYTRVLGVPCRTQLLKPNAHRCSVFLYILTPVFKDIMQSFLPETFAPRAAMMQDIKRIAT